MTGKPLTHAEHFRWMQAVLAVRDLTFTYAQKTVLPKGGLAEVFVKVGTANETQAGDAPTTASLFIQQGGSAGILRRASTCNGDGTASGALGLLDIL